MNYCFVVPCRIAFRLLIVAFTLLIIFYCSIGPFKCFLLHMKIAPANQFAFFTIFHLMHGTPHMGRPLKELTKLDTGRYTPECLTE